MSFCKDCIVAVTHEGTPTGKIEQIGGVETYVALPEGDYPKDKALLLLTDVFGIKFPNNQLLADDFARNGFAVYIPDYLNGDAIIDSMFGNPNWDIGRDWFPTHTAEQTRPPLDKVIAGLKERGVTTLGVAGYCFGGRYAVDLALENAVKAIVISHPSLLQVPADFEKLLATSSAPLLINSCEKDDMFPPSAQATTDELLGAASTTSVNARSSGTGCAEHRLTERSGTQGSSGQSQERSGALPSVRCSLGSLK
ncbi:alpha/beta-hydrolase [Exidia glandulosa HHB12029]|uniref:Alpha/beta-hydrolase n=1 Tax=Exidia glandulosa HHB12029 TaxID=1314781 RepID=A0A165Q526_EXIGL|nr:alpha/beta-hydrolase [Exidia glandulosa HHB12029]